MAGHAVEHDYHLIPPSPWPFLSGIAALIWGAGMVVFFAGLQPRTGESPMMEFFFSKGLDSLQDSYRAAGDKVGADGGWILLLLGSLFAIYVMIGWWKDVAAESKAGSGCSSNLVCSTKCAQNGTQTFLKMRLLTLTQWLQVSTQLTRGTYRS